MHDLVLQKLEQTIVMVLMEIVSKDKQQNFQVALGNCAMVTKIS